MATDDLLGGKDIEALRERLIQVRESIALAARAAGRRPEEITLIGVSKFQSAEMAMAAFDLGLADLGENRVQEMTAKISALAATGRMPRWHMIGTLQRNKVKFVAGKVELIHSVDSAALLADIARISIDKGRVSKILLQVNTAGEVSKHGFSPEELATVAERSLQTAGISLCGLMAMAPLTPDPDLALPVFAATRETFERLAQQLGHPPPFQVLSMGMSQDFRQAIACGATHVRIGTAIFGPRL